MRAIVLMPQLRSTKNRKFVLKMKKNLLTLILLSATLVISACHDAKPSYDSSIDSSSYQSESSTSSESSISSDSNESQFSSSSLDSSSSDESTSSSSSDISSSSSSSQSESTSSSSCDISSSSSSSVSSSSSELSSSSESISSVDSSSSSSIEESSSSSSSSTIEPELTPQYAASSYKDLFHNSMYSLSCTPSVGETHILVIPIWFTDSKNYILEANKENVRSDIETAYFGSNDETGWRSVKTYYEEESHGVLTLTGVVSDWYECGQASSYYRKDANVSKTSSLVTTASDWYFKENKNASRLDYDKDQDGYLDGVMLIYAAPDQQASGHSEDSNYSNMWAYCFWVQDPNVQDYDCPGANAFFWASYDFMYGKAKANARTGKTNNLFNGDTRYCNIDAHTFIHEMGHMFGLNDYYDYSGQYNPAGGFSMQDSNVGGHDPFSSFALGWGKAYIPTETITINLKPFATTGEMILLSPSFNQYNSPFDEYLLLEFYTPTGLNNFDSTYQYTSSMYPKGPKAMGIRLWHVDDRLFYESRNSYKITTNPNDPLHNVAEAFSNTYDDGSGDMDDYLSPLGSSYYNFNQLQLIRNSTTATYKPTDDFTANSLFKAGNTFNMNTYKSQFVKSGKLNQNIDLGYTFAVDNVNEEYATITITKL